VKFKELMSTNHTKPAISLRNFANKLIDYAGLFPPANLELLQAFHNFIFYSQSENKWMLNKFIIPAKRLDELSKILNEMTIEGVVPLSVLGSGGDTTNAFKSNLANDLSSMRSFLDKHKSLISIDVFETKLPGELTGSDKGDELPELMQEVSKGLEEALCKSIPVFFEVNLKENHEEVIIRTVESIGAVNADCGFKLRTGGTEASAFPATQVIAFAIMTCTEFGVPMKCTAGLHHPLRHYDESVSGYMHGFFNVFGAGLMSYTNNFDEEGLLEILNDEDPFEFAFDEEGLLYNDTRVTNEEIIEARKNLMISYGSCSFDDPVNDLKTMELL
jgi:hypothetical protein